MREGNGIGYQRKGPGRRGGGAMDGPASPPHANAASPPRACRSPSSCRHPKKGGRGHEAYLQVWAGGMAACDTNGGLEFAGLELECLLTDVCIHTLCCPNLLLVPFPTLLSEPHQSHARARTHARAHRILPPRFPPLPGQRWYCPEPDAGKDLLGQEQTQWPGEGLHPAWLWMPAHQSACKEWGGVDRS